MPFMAEFVPITKADEKEDGKMDSSYFSIFDFCTELLVISFRCNVLRRSRP